MQESIIPYLHLLSSDNELTNEHAAKLIIIKSTINPQLILNATNDIFLFIRSITSVDNPKWGVVSSLILAITNAINLQPNSFMGNANPDPNLQYLVTFIQISQCITQRYFLSTEESCVAPFLLPFSQTLKKILSVRTVFPRDPLLSITDHCAVGFVPGASFIPFLVKMWGPIYQTFQSSPVEDFYRLSQPISSSNKEVVIFYLTLWCCSMPEMINYQEALNNLRNQNRKLLELIEKDEIPFRSPSVYLLDCIKSFTQERIKLIQIGRDNKNEWVRALTMYIQMTVNEKEEPIDIHSITSTKAKITSKVERLMEIPADIMVKKKTKRFYLYFIPDAKIFAWAPNTDMKQAQYLHLTEIASAKLDNLNQNLLNVVTFKGESYQFIFNSTIYSKLFSDALNSH